MSPVRVEHEAGHGASEFERARRETVRYHEDLYSSATLGQEGTWLAKPHGLLLDALARIPSGRPVIAYDLGSGIGRHTIPMMQRLPVGSEVYAIDLLSSALQSLCGSVPPGVRTVLHTRRADLDDFVFQTPADLVLAFSAIEHLPSLAAIRRLLERVHAAVNPGGVVAIGVVADRFEIDARGNRRLALIESAISSAEADELLTSVFTDFEVDYRKALPADVRENRDGETYMLTSTLLTWLGTRPGESTPRQRQQQGRLLNGCRRTAARHTERAGTRGRCFTPGASARFPPSRYCTRRAGSRSVRGGRGVRGLLGGGPAGEEPEGVVGG